MGIKGLTRLISDNAPEAITYKKIGAYQGRRIAIDASMSIYQFMIAVRPGMDGMMLTDASGAETSHLVGLLYRTIRLMMMGIKPLYVFDGKPPEMKSEELVKRREARAKAEAELLKATKADDAEAIEKFSKRTLRVTKEHMAECQRLLTLMGVPWIEAPSEAEAQCAALAKAGKVFAAGSEDTDTLTFGSPILLRNLTASAARKLDIMELDLERALQGLGLTMAQFIDVCILCGCDYCDSIRGIGPVRALQFIKQYGSIEGMLEKIDTTKYVVPDNWNFAVARRLFTDPDVMPADQVDLKANAEAGLDETGLMQYLVEEKGFDTVRISRAVQKIKDIRKKAKGSQTHLDSFFGRPTVIVNQNRKRKAIADAKAKRAGKKRKGNGKPRR
ncbi:flap structure specific endonuclease 1 [Thecamonas trahens ATCC 50062]|uniref:Flap endonuclease 1 n=1 Tax=Thecamonas trahens ATCC 50062 TaxID=461836 RepID=A0A0L0DWY4_THETB|nr:flap structure specific endonuclease 1 [Thecamonas trahens ATCC 50062]KNC56053.1 flap structure specific endonuclease 1 [Thecamonas trahens ATCC 50062]|eukprot:XP_013761097.1 flap structure specific endonuclease 1 [Thecamonas trahens ATCC 50062]